MSKSHRKFFSLDFLNISYAPTDDYSSTIWLENTLGVHCIYICDLFQKQAPQFCSFSSFYEKN